MKHTIKLSSIEKKIEDNMVLRDINIELESGNIYGFVGKNGSGKTMLFRMIAGLVKPDAGQILIDERSVKFNEENLLSIGLIIENAGLYKEFTARENLKLLASIRGVIGDDEIDAVIRKVGLDPKDKRKVGKYSLGMRQRLLFAQAVMESPDVLLLDEPTNALDKEGINMIRELILKERSRGALICLASHNEADISMLCDKIFKMDMGELVNEKGV